MITNTLIQTCNINTVEPFACLIGILQRVVSGQTKNHESQTLLMWNRCPPSTSIAA